MRGLTKIGVEAVIRDRQREAIGPGLPALLLPDADALNKAVLRRTDENAMCRRHGFSLLSGSTDMSISNVSVKIDSTSLAV